jgi:hypothetical protein
MKIRRLQYNIDYTHILTFREEYKRLVLPYFGFDNLRYGIDNEYTINESIRLIFETEKLALSIRKEGITCSFEGDIKDVKNQSGPIKFFWDIYDGIKKLEGYKKTNRHSLLLHAVDIIDKDEIDKILTNNPYLKINPFNKLEEFAAVYHFKKEDKFYKFTFGNYSEKDIKIYDLRPFKTEYNKDLLGSYGLMSQFELYEDISNPTFSRFKALLTDAESKISSFELITNVK